MPYIPKDDRKYAARFPDTPGELNYALTKILVYWVGKNPNYATYNAAIGALECAKLELYRRMVSPYEDKKRVENGDVYLQSLVRPTRGGE